MCSYILTNNMYIKYIIVTNVNFDAHISVKKYLYQFEG